MAFLTAWMTKDTIMKTFAALEDKLANGRKEEKSTYFWLDSQKVQTYTLSFSLSPIQVELYLC